MSSINQDLQNLGIDISNLDLNIDISQFDDMFDPSNMHIYQKSSKTTYLTAGQTVNYSVNIRGKVFPAFLTFHSGKLTYLNVKNGSNLNNPYKIIGGSLTNVKMDLDIVDGGQRVSFIDFLFEYAKAASSSEHYKNMDKTAWIDHLNKMGITFPTGAPMFFKQWGGNIDSYNEFLETLRSKGITLQPNKKTMMRSNDPSSNMQEGWDITTVTGVNGSKPGLDVIEFEVSPTDRTKSTPYKDTNGRIQQGFIDFGDALFENFDRVTKLRKTAALYRKLIEVNADKLTQAETKMLGNKIEECNKGAALYANHLGGSHLIEQKQPNGTYVPTSTYGADEVNCGRLGFLINDEIVKVSFWTNETNPTQETTVTNQAVTASDLSKIAGFANS